MDHTTTQKLLLSSQYPGCAPSRINNKQTLGKGAGHSSIWQHLVCKSSLCDLVRVILVLPSIKVYYYYTYKTKQIYGFKKSSKTYVANWINSERQFLLNYSCAVYPWLVRSFNYNWRKITSLFIASDLLNMCLTMLMPGYKTFNKSLHSYWNPQFLDEPLSSSPDNSFTLHYQPPDCWCSSLCGAPLYSLANLKTELLALPSDWDSDIILGTGSLSAVLVHCLVIILSPALMF